jgi:MerR family transcriptional regulator, light-induced transcriptional regulator
MLENRPTYNLKAAIRETGLTAETLRAWERRYGLVKPKRSPGGHRLYSFKDIQILKWLVQRQQEGMSISRAVEMWRSLEESGQDPLESGADRSVILSSEDGSLDDLRNKWIQACLEFNEPEAEKIANMAFAVAAPETVLVNLFQKGLSIIGEHWYTGKASVQQEHFASAVAMRRLYNLLSAAPLPNRNEYILLACPPEEDHEFGLLMVAVLLRRRGWRVVYLGPNVPLYRLEEALRAIKPTLVVSLAQGLTQAKNLREMAVMLADHKIKVAYGGRVFIEIPELTEKIPGTFIGNEIEEIVLSIDRLVKEKAPAVIAEEPDERYLQTMHEFSDNSAIILGRVVQRLNPESQDRIYVQEMNRVARENLPAALALGDTCYLFPSLRWVEGYMIQNGRNKDILEKYLELLIDEVNNLLPEQQEIITGCLKEYLSGKD